MLMVNFNVNFTRVFAISWFSVPDFGQKWLSDYPHFETKWWLLHINLGKPLFLLVKPNIFFINYIDSWSSHMSLRSFLMLIGSPPYIGRRINYTSLYQLLATISVDNDCSQRQCCNGRLTIIIINYHYWILLAIPVSSTPLLSI